MQGVRAVANPSHREGLERGGSEGKFDSSVPPSLETQPHFHQVESLPESFEPKASCEGEKRLLVSLEAVASLHLSWSQVRLEQPEGEGAGHRLERPGEATHSWGEAGMRQPRWLCEALSGDSSSAALTKLSLEKLVLTWGLNQALGVRVIWKG